MGARCFRCGKKPAEDGKSKGDKPDEAAKGSKKTEKGHGYTVEEFVNDSLVPVYGYACWQPMEPKRKKELEHQMKQLNKFINNDPKYDFRFGGRSGGNSEGSQKKPDLPFQAICHVRLTKAVPDGSAGQSFDFNQETRLKVEVHGRLCFPPDEEPKEDVPKGKGKMEDKIFLDRRWFLAIVVHVVLERAHEEVTDGSDEQAADVGATKLKVKVESMDVERHVDETSDAWVGDPMVDSWLPVADIQQDIEGMLQKQLEKAVSGFDIKNEN
mmetsp:Transcript_127351/g.220755  ORF Transcript_127351/g.220755 Transcript_127351/m.220755 type:complete len:269 (-) Transcript_127351:191-997(-)